MRVLPPAVSTPRSTDSTRGAPLLVLLFLSLLAPQLVLSSDKAQHRPAEQAFALSSKTHTKTQHTPAAVTTESVESAESAEHALRLALSSNKHNKAQRKPPVTAEPAFTLRSNKAQSPLHKPTEPAFALSSNKTQHKPAEPAYALDPGPATFRLPAACLAFFANATSRERRERTITHWWQRARQLAGLLPLGPEALRARLKFMSSFYNGSRSAHGAQCVPAGACSTDGTHPPNEAFAYVRVWKSANNFFSHNIKLGCGHAEAECKPLSSRRVAPFQFAFVRDPLAHFLSGYTETTWRTYYSCCEDFSSVHPDDHHKKYARYNAEQCTCAPQCCAARQRQGSTELAKEFIIALLDANATAVWSDRHALTCPAHMYVQATILCDWQLDFIGHLESLQDDWNNLAQRARLPSADHFLIHQASHPYTSEDELGRRAAMLQLLDDEPRLKAALLQLLQIDYDCFDAYASRRSNSSTIPSDVRVSNTKEANATVRMTAS